MIREPLRSIKRNRIRPAFLALVALLASLVAAPQLFSDEPYARSRDYDLQHSKISLRFDLDNKKVLGEVTHSLAILRDGTAKIVRSEEHTSELQSRVDLVCRLLLEKKKHKK